MQFYQQLCMLQVCLCVPADLLWESNLASLEETQLLWSFLAKYLIFCWLQRRIRQCYRGQIQKDVPAASSGSQSLGYWENMVKTVPILYLPGLLHAFHKHLLLRWKKSTKLDRPVVRSTTAFSSLPNRRVNSLLRLQPRSTPSLIHEAGAEDHWS